MTQNERSMFLINYLKNEASQYEELEIPDSESERFYLLRALMNVRMPAPVGEDFLAVQDEYLKTLIEEKGVTEQDSLMPVEEDIYLWQGDITTLRCGAIVNAANSRLLGCFCPNHACIDNAIHTFAGVGLRLACDEIMKKQGHPEETGGAKITPAFNLPSEYIIHTVGPIVHGELTENDEKLLADCYLSCLKKADEIGLSSIAFCCISTGEFHFPNGRAAEIAVNTVREYKKANNSRIKVIFNVFKELDLKIYKKLFGLDR